MKTFENDGMRQYECPTCNEGKICEDCMFEKDPVAFDCSCKKRREIEHGIKCPCCRQLNWRYHYSEIIMRSFEDELECGTYFPAKKQFEYIMYPAHRLYLINRIGQDDFNDQYGVEGVHYGLIKIINF
jgi:hypothetical protein